MCVSSPPPTKIWEFVVELPPVRKCREDILPLAEFFIGEMNAELKKSVSGFDAEAKKLLALYHWPGNVRELRQVVQTAVLMTGEGLILSDALGLDATEAERGVSDFALIDETMQKDRIIKALKQTDGNKRQAAKLLGISPPTLYKKMEQYNIQ